MVETGKVTTFGSEADMEKFMLSTGPISIAVDASMWNTYKSGIFPTDQCEGMLDHAVQAIGINTEAPIPYWTVYHKFSKVPRP